MDGANISCFQAYIKQLESNPLRTKMLTAGTLAGLQEVIASWLAKDRNKHGHYFTSRVPKMAAYGALVSAPIGHFLIWCLQKTFQDRTSLKAKIFQILASNLIVSTSPSHYRNIPAPGVPGLTHHLRLLQSKTAYILSPWL
jgi:hypothetical protein